MVVSRNFRKKVCRAWHERSQPAMEASSRAAQVLHVHVLLVAPLGAGHMAQPGTDQHEAELPSGKLPTPSAAADLPVQPFNDVIGTDASPMFTGEIAVSQRFLNAILTFLAASFSFMERSCSTTALAFSRAALLLSWAWIA